MNHPLYYPKIPNTKTFPFAECIAFEKYDGTNLHFRWDRDFGWHAFGTRRDEFNLDDRGEALFRCEHPELRDVPELFRQTWAAPLAQTFGSWASTSSMQECTAFAEYFGASSFAGRHRIDEAKKLVLFDVACDEKLLGPFEFVERFGHLPIARVVYRGKFTGAFAEDVRCGKYDVMEGVICKTGRGDSDLWMAKIKTYAYLERLKQSYGEKWEQYWE